MLPPGVSGHGDLSRIKLLVKEQFGSSQDRKTASSHGHVGGHVEGHVEIRFFPEKEGE